MARPRKYLTPDELTKLTDMAARGFSHARMAAALGFDLERFRRCLAEDSKAAGALAEGLSEEEASLVAALRRQAEQGSTQAACFLLATRHHWRAHEGVRSRPWCSGSKRLKKQSTASSGFSPTTPARRGSSPYRQP